MWDFAGVVDMNAAAAEKRAAAAAYI